MIILEITKIKALRTFTPHSAFVYKCYPALRQTASYWTDIFGASANNSEETANISSVIANSVDAYYPVFSISDCQMQEKSFYFDFPNQILYFHINPDTLANVENIANGKGAGYTDSNLVYIGNIPYSPLIRSIPPLSQQADLQQYDQMAFVAGSLVLNNIDGQFDDIIDNNIYGNDIRLYHLIEHEGDYSRDELIPLNNFYIENYDFSLSDFTIAVQDKRKGQNTNLLNEFYEGGAPVPLIYGKAKAIEAKAIDEAVAPSFRVATHLTDIGIIECEGDYGWQETAPISVDLATGTFKLSATFARSPGNGLGEDTGSILPCRVRGLTGYANTSALDIIKDINTRVIGVDYTSSNYDIPSWEAAASLISPIGIVFKDQQKTFEAIQKIQSGCNIGFRYEINPQGKRNVKLDDWALPIQYHVSWHDIKDNLTLKVSSDSELLAAKVVVNYDKDYIEDTYSSYTDNSKYSEVQDKYRQTPTISVDTYLLTEVLAMQRAEYEANRFSTIPRILEAQLHGSKWYGVQIYDIITIELEVPRREYFGTWKAQILAVNPALGQLTNSIRAVLIERAI